MTTNTQLSAQGIGLDDTDYSKFEVYVPDSLKFRTTKQGLPAKRVPIKVRSEQQSYGSDNNKLIRIILPNNAIYDTRNGYLTFNLTLTTTGGTYRRIHQGVFSIFNRFRVLVAQSEVEDIRDYNRIYSALWEMKNPTEVVSAIGVDVMGFGTQAERNALSPNFDYCMPVMSGILNNELLPFDNLKTGMILEFYLDDPTHFVETDGTLPVVTLSNIVFHYERLELSPSYRKFISDYVAKNGLQIGFHTWERYINALTTGTRQNLQINHRSSSMNGMLNILVDSSNLSNMAVNDKFLTWLPLSLTQTSTIINGTVFPDEPIDTVTARRIEPYQMYCRWIQKWKLNGILPIAPSIANDSFNTVRFVQIDDFEPYPECSDIINPFTTLRNNSTIIKKLEFSGAVPAGYQLDTWVEYFQQVMISPDGSVHVLR